MKLVPATLQADPDNSAFRKAHEAIAVLPQSGRLTLLDRRFFNVLLALAQEQGDRTTYRAKFARILAGAKFDSKNTEVAKEHLRKMTTTRVEWNSTSDTGKRRWGVSTLIADAEIIEENRELIVEWSYSPKVKAKLLNPDVYVQLSLEIHSALRSSQSAALYEICTRYVTNPGHLTHRAPWQWWKPRLTGNPEDIQNLGEYKYFKRDVLRTAISEINAITDIDIELIEHRDGRKVSEIQFKVTKKAQRSLSLPEENLIDNSLLERLLALGFNTNAAAQLYSNTDEQKLRLTLSYVESRVRAKNMEALNSPAAFFRVALKEGYAKDNLLTSAADKGDKTKRGGRSKKPDPATESGSQSPLLGEDGDKGSPIPDGVISEYRMRFAGMSSVEQATWLHRFTEAAEFSAIRPQFMKKGLNSPLVAATFYGWLSTALIKNQ